jgi:hypothetical protein
MHIKSTDPLFRHMLFGYEANYNTIKNALLYKTVATDIPEAIRIMRSLLLLVVTQRVVVNPSRRFGTINRSHLQGSINLIYIAAVALNHASR